MKKKIIRIVVFLCSLIAFSCLVFLIFWLTGIITLDNGISFNLDLFRAIKGHWWSWLVFFILQVVITTLLSFAPCGSMAFILIGVALFGANWQTFLLCYAGVITSSLLMDSLGRAGGGKAIVILIGKEDYEKAVNLIKEKGISYLPLFYIFPVFPDDAICMVAGMLKVNYRYHLICIVLCRGIGVATIVFGISLIPFETFTTLWDWIICLTVIVFWVIVAFYITTKINIYLGKKKKKKGER